MVLRNFFDTWSVITEKTGNLTKTQEMYCLFYSGNFDETWIVQPSILHHNWGGRARVWSGLR